MRYPRVKSFVCTTKPIKTGEMTITHQIYKIVPCCLIIDISEQIPTHSYTLMHMLAHLLGQNSFIHITNLISELLLCAQHHALLAVCSVTTCGPQHCGAYSLIFPQKVALLLLPASLSSNLRSSFSTAPDFCSRAFTLLRPIREPHQSI